MNRIARNSMFFVCAIAVLTFGAGSVLAQTADGLTPAVEQDCSELSGAAFGLCNAYCEAMDCHMHFDADTTTSANASETACLKVKENFIKISGLGALPCECPDGPGQFGCACDDDNACDSGLTCEDSICIVDGNDGGDEGGF